MSDFNLSDGSWVGIQISVSEAKLLAEFLNSRRSLDGGCAQCVRGLICEQCNLVVVRFLELYPDRGTVAEQIFMSDRPLLRYRAEGIANRVPLSR